MDRKKVEQVDLVAASGVNRTTVNNLVTGQIKNPPRFDTMESIVLAMRKLTGDDDIEIDDLF